LTTLRLGQRSLAIRPFDHSLGLLAQSFDAQAHDVTGPQMTALAVERCGEQ